MKPANKKIDLSGRGILLAICTIFGMGYIICAYGSVANSSFGNFRQNAGIISAFISIIAIFLLSPKSFKPNLSWLPIGSLLFLLLLGTYMVWNAETDHSLKTFEVINIGKAPLENLKGSIARSSSLRAIIEFSCIFIAAFAFAKSAKSKAWKWWLVIIAGFGLFVTMTGLSHKALGMKTIWGFEEISHFIPPTFFAPYVYNANAGAFLNLAFPIAFSLGVGNLTKSRNKSLGWFLLSGGIFAGLLSTASKGVIALSFLSLAILFLLHRRHFKLPSFNKKNITSRSFEKLFFGIFAALLFLVLAGFGLKVAIERWVEFYNMTMHEGGALSYIGRVRVMGILIEMITDHGGFFGFGPGTFPHLLPYYTADMGDYISGRWDHAHCDILQTIVEWGYLGAASWFTFGAGAWVCGFLLLRTRALSSHSRSLVKGLLVALGITSLHTIFDFPLSIFSIHLVAVSYCAILWGLHYNKS